MPELSSTGRGLRTPFLGLILLNYGNISSIEISLNTRYNSDMWEVRKSKKAEKEILKLPKKVRDALDLLLKEIELSGPYRSNWSNYGKLKGKLNTYHCHIKKGKPTYVAVWVIVDKKIKITEVNYVGTHEKAPY